MRISYLLTLGDTGGSVVLYRCMDQLAAQGHEVFAVTPSERIAWESGFSSLILQKLHSSNRNVSKTMHGYAKQLAKTSPVLERYARAITGKSISRMFERFNSGMLKHWIPSDVTVATYHLSAYAAYFLMDRTTTLYHMQSYEELFFNDDLSRKLARLTCYLPLELFANSSWLQGQIAQRFGRKARLLFPGIDSATFYPRVEHKAKYTTPSKVTIVSYYSPDRIKGWDEALTAMRIVLGTLGARAEWVVFGGRPPVLPDVPVTFVGRILHDDLARLYSGAHICFMNSWFESFPLPPLEAMASGTAVICTRFGTEDYAFDKQNALVVPPRRPAELADAILRLAQHPRDAMDLAAAGVGTAREFTWARTGEALERAINEASAGHHNNFDDIPRFFEGA